MKDFNLLLFILGITCLSFAIQSKKIDVVQNFDSNKYLGKWYEIARIDYKWEKNLNNVTANYSLNENGTIKVENKGFDQLKNKWKTATGKAKFAGNTNQGKLKVSFLGPFYAAYNIVALDPEYKYALVIGSSPDNMWILSRDTAIPEFIKKAYLQKAQELGVQTAELIWVEHTQKQ
jgi:apolipoprotein D and lipocalin family protein